MTEKEEGLRKLVVCNIASVDAYFEGPGGDVLALPMDAFFDAHNLERLRAATTLLVGAKTFLGLKAYWPAVAEDPTRSPAVAADASVAELHRETGQRNAAIEKVVVSDTLTEADTAPWTSTTRIVRRGDAANVVAGLKAGDGGDILTFGSRTTWNALAAAGLVDELHVMVGAKVVGAGTPLFGEALAGTSLGLLDVERREGSSNVVLRYALDPR